MLVDMLTNITPPSKPSAMGEHTVITRLSIHYDNLNSTIMHTPISSYFYRMNALSGGHGSESRPWIKMRHPRGTIKLRNKMHHAHVIIP